MKSLLMPGYEELFGRSSISYEKLLENLSSNTAIMILANLNAELNAYESHQDAQDRILERVTFRFSEMQLNFLKKALSEFAIKFPEYDGALFGRRYLLSMMIKEIERNNKVNNESDDPVQEFNFFLAYLMCVDEVDNSDRMLFNKAKEHKVELMPMFPLIWAANICQYEFNERANPAFELFKLLSFCKYAYDYHKASLKELINKQGFKNIAQFVGSFHQIARFTLNDNPNEFLRRLYFITPKLQEDISHLKSLSINPLLGKKVELSDLKKHPLYETDERGFMIIDEDMYKRKIYRGPLFDLHKQTSLKKLMSFPDYKEDVSKKCFEKILFKGISNQLAQDKSIAHYDDNANIAEPDLYYRSNEDIILIEFKDYLFPDAVSTSNNFKDFEKYINERLVLSDKEKHKGVGQLVNNISNLLSLKYAFDSEGNEQLRSGKKLNIHPIICHTDFMFGMPGVNEYLNTVFKQKLIAKELAVSNINNITLLNLEVLYDLALRGKDFSYLLNLIKRYYVIISLKRKQSAETSSITDFMASTASFDEIYQTIFRNELIDSNMLGNESSTKAMINIVGIKQEQIDEIL